MREQAHLVQEADLKHEVVVEEGPQMAVPLGAPQGDLAHAHVAPHPVHHILRHRSHGSRGQVRIPLGNALMESA